MKNSNSTERDKPHFLEHRKRLRARYIKSPESFSDYEILELLLTYAVPRKDVKPIAKKLIRKYGSISEILACSVDELKENQGISDNTALFITLLRDIVSRIFADEIREKDLVNSPGEVVNFARAKLGSEKNEVFLIIYVNARNRMEGFEIMNEGTVDYVVIYPRKIIKQALKYNATRLIVIHNHPSGECDPSAADIRLTESLKKAANVMDILLLDHIVVGGSRYFSFKEENLL
jgi:DNA repair protein RadC